MNQFEPTILTKHSFDPRPVVPPNPTQQHTKAIKQMKIYDIGLKDTNVKMQMGFSFSLKSESYSSFDIIAGCGRFYSVLEEDLCRKR